MKTDSPPEIFVSRQEAARTGSLLAKSFLQKILDTTNTKDRSFLLHVEIY